MKIKHPLVSKVGGLAITVVTRVWMSTLDYRVAYYDSRLDPAHPDFQGPAIFVFWHEYIPFPLYLRGHCNIAMLLSHHQDAEWLSAATRHLGFETVRGSSSRGGATALRELFRRSRSMNLTMTPDGPRGPRRQMALGPLYLSSRLDIPLVLCGFGYDRPWRLNTWDKFAIPRPYTRARAIIGPAIQLPPRLDRDALQRYRAQVEQTLTQNTEACQRWAEDGSRWLQQQPLRREGMPPDGLQRRAA
jgi:hypothetical protein